MAAPSWNTLLGTIDGLDTHNGDGTWGGGSGGTALVPTCPSTVNANDLLLLQVMTYGSAATTLPINTPSGWTSHSTDISGARRQGIYYKIADGTEDGATVGITGTYSGSPTAGVYMAMARIYRVLNPATSGTLTESGGATSGTDGTSEPASVTAGSTAVSPDNRLGMVFLAVVDDDHSLFISTNGWTFGASGVDTSGSDGSLAVAYRSIAPGATVGTSPAFSFTNTGSDTWMCRSVAIVGANTVVTGGNKKILRRQAIVRSNYW